MMKDLISVIVPVYNVESYLEKCLDSICNQEYKNLEIILVDDGSSDRSGKICDLYKEADNRIKVIHKNNGGLSDARNVGLENSNGEWIVFIDSDDWIEKDFISCLYELCISNHTLMAVCKGKKVYEDGKIEIDATKMPIANHKAVVDKYYMLKGYDGFWGTSWNRICNKELYEDIRFPVGKIHEDEATTYKLVYKCERIAITDMLLYNYRIRNGSITNSKKKVVNTDIVNILQEKYEYFLAKHDSVMVKASVVELLVAILEKINEEGQENSIRSALINEYKIIYSALTKHNIPGYIKILFKVYGCLPFVFRYKGKQIYAKFMLKQLYYR